MASNGNCRDAARALAGWMVTERFMGVITDDISPVGTGDFWFGKVGLIAVTPWV